MHLINRTNVRLYALFRSKDMRNGRFTRVSDKWLRAVEEHLKAFVIAKVREHPSRGKTIMPWY